jgi:hypothetical protein
MELHLLPGKKLATDIHAKSPKTDLEGGFYLFQVAMVGTPADRSVFQPVLRFSYKWSPEESFTIKGKGTTFAPGKDINKAIGYIESWGEQDDIEWVADKLKQKVDNLELLTTVDMAICGLKKAETLVSIATSSA